MRMIGTVSTSPGFAMQERAQVAEEEKENLQKDLLDKNAALAEVRIQG